MKGTDPPVTIPVLGNDAPSSGQQLVLTTVDLDPATAGLQSTVILPEGTWAASPGRSRDLHPGERLQRHG